MTEMFSVWMDGLRDARAASRIAQRIVRLSHGLAGDVRPVGHGVLELRIDEGAGYRVHFVQRGNALIVLLCGGDKSRQRRDIAVAQRLASELEI